MTLKKGLYFKEDNQVSFMESFSPSYQTSVFLPHTAYPMVSPSPSHCHCD